VERPVGERQVVHVVDLRRDPRTEAALGGARCELGIERRVVVDSDDLRLARPRQIDGLGSRAVRD
jgi:hypothetical protein